MAADLRIWLLGGFRSALGTEPVPAHAWRRARATSLVKLLALAPGHRLHRELLTETLWPEADPEVSAAGLRKAVHFARQALSADSIRIRDQVVALEAPSLWTDVEAFEAAASAGDTATALALYQGDLLPEDRFEAWADEPRERLRRRLADLLLTAAGDAERDGDARAALTSLERLVVLDPLNEQAAAALMRLHATSGQRHLALRTYQRLEDLLRDDLGVSPGDQLVRLRDDIAAGRLAISPAPVSSAASMPAERKLVTILSADVSALPGSCADPEQVQRHTDARCAAAIGILESWGACVERLAGGSLLAVFGIPAVREDDTVRALRAGLGLLASLAHVSAGGEPAPSVRIGIEAGEVLVTESAHPRAVAGTALEVARRLCEIAAPGTVMAGERAWSAAHNRFRFARSGTARVPVGYRLLAASDDAAVASTPATPMVGRSAELAAILALVNDATDSGRPRLLTIVGAAGVGKSRLVGEAVAALTSRQPDCRILRGRCISTADGVTDWALGEVVRDVCGIPFGEGVDAAAARLRRGVAALLSSDAESEVESMVFALATTAGIALPDNPLARAEPAAVADALAAAWPRFMGAIAAQGPVVVVVEDLHWAGERLVEMLGRITLRAAGPLVFLATARPEMLQEHPGFGAGSDTTSSITLPALTEAASRELLEALPGAAGLAGAQRLEVLARAEGNPYFLEELVAHVAEGETSTLPDSLRSLLAARVDALPPAEKRVLQEASVVGRVFWSEPVARCLGHNIDGALAGLEGRGLVLHRMTTSLAGHRELSFKHALLRDVAYASIPLSRRARAHAEVAAWMEGLHGARQALTELLAHHYAAAAAETSAWADDSEREPVRLKAFDYLLQAGTSAGHRYAMRKAIGLHERALEMARGDAERLQALEALGDDHAAAYHGDAAERCYRDALHRARAEPDLSAARSRLAGKLALLMGDVPGAFRENPRAAAAEELIAEGLAAAQDDVDRARVLLARGAAARLYRGSAPFGQGDTADPLPIEDRIAGVTEALRIVEQRGDATLVASAAGVLAILYGIAGRYTAMVDVVERELAALLETPARQRTADALRKRAGLAVELEGRFEAGLELARRAYALTVEEPNPHQLMHSTYTLISALHRLGRWEEGLAFVDEHAAAFLQDPAAHCQAVRDGTVIGAVTLTYCGRMERARELFALTGDPADDIGSASAWQSRYALVSGDARLAVAISETKARDGRLYSPQHAAVLLDALAELGDWEALASFLPRARTDISGNALLGPTADRAEALMLAARGDRTAALPVMRRAVRRFDALSEVFQAACTRVMLAELEPDAERARALRDGAVATAQQLGALAFATTARSRAVR